MPDNVILDSCIFVEAWTEGEFMDPCQKYIKEFMGDKRKRCLMPILIPGEVIKNILGKTDDKGRITDILREYKHVFLNHNIQFIDIDDEVLEIKDDLKDLRIGEHDKLNIACAIAADSSEIITLDVGISEEKEKISSICKRRKGHRLNITILKPDRKPSRFRRWR